MARLKPPKSIASIKYIRRISDRSSFTLDHFSRRRLPFNLRTWAYTANTKK